MKKIIKERLVRLEAKSTGGDLVPVVHFADDPEPANALMRPAICIKFVNRHGVASIAEPRELDPRGIWQRDN